MSLNLVGLPGPPYQEVGGLLACSETLAHICKVRTCHNDIITSKHAHNTLTPQANSKEGLEHHSWCHNTMTSLWVDITELQTSHSNVPLSMFTELNYSLWRRMSFLSFLPTHPYNIIFACCATHCLEVLPILPVTHNQIDPFNCLLFHYHWLLVGKQHRKVW